MDLNKEEKEILIHLLTDEINKNFYNIEAKKLLEKVKITDEKTIKNTKLAKDAKYAKIVINAFYDAGVIPTTDASNLTNIDINRMADFFELTIKADEINRKFFRNINGIEFENYEEKFEPYIIEYAKEIIKIANEIKKTKVD